MKREQHNFDQAGRTAAQAIGEKESVFSTGTGKSRFRSPDPLPVKRQSCQEHFWAALKQTLRTPRTPVHYNDY